MKLVYFFVKPDFSCKTCVVRLLCLLGEWQPQKFLAIKGFLGDFLNYLLKMLFYFVWFLSLRHDKLIIDDHVYIYNDQVIS